MKILKSSLIVAGLVVACAVAVCAADKVPSTMTPKPASGDVSWLKDADTAGNAEVAAAQLALTKATRDDVKAFAKKMSDDHGMANKELGAIAAKKGIALPAGKPSTKDLDSVSGTAFDDAYLKGQVKDHEAAEKLFEKGAKSSDADIKAFAEKTLPTIQAHLAEVRRLAGLSSK